MRILVRWAIAALVSLPLVAQGRSVEEIVAERNQEGVLAYDQGQFDAAIAAFEAARALDGKNGTLAKNLARALHARASQRTKAATLDSAADDLRRALALDPNEPRISESLVSVLKKAGRNQESRVVLDQALVRSPEAPNLWEVKGRSQYEEEDLAAALESLKKAIELGSTRAAEIRPLIEKIRREQEVEGAYLSESRGQFVVKYDSESLRGTSVTVLDLLDRWNGKLQSEFRCFPDRRITIVLYSREDFDAATGAREWAGGLFDGKIRLPVRNFRKVAAEIESTLAHELTHVFVESLAPRCPLWLNEGVAQYFEGKRPTERSRGTLVKRLAAGELPEFSALPAVWATIEDAALVNTYYTMSLSLVVELVTKHGWLSVRDLVVATGSGESLAVAAPRLFGMEWSEIEARWRQNLR